MTKDEFIQKAMISMAGNEYYEERIGDIQSIAKALAEKAEEISFFSECETNEGLGFINDSLFEISENLKRISVGKDIIKNLKLTPAQWQRLDRELLEE